MLLTYIQLKLMSCKLSVCVETFCEAYLIKALFVRQPRPAGEPAVEVTAEV